MKKGILILSGAFLLQLHLSSCSSGTAADNDAIAADTTIISKGHQLFSEKCNSCHNIYFDGIGPRLAGITETQPVSWIKNFIKDPKKVIDSGDTTAQKLYKTYKAIMPAFGYLPEEQIDAVVAYIHSEKKLQRKPVKEDPNDIKNPIPDSIQTSDVVVEVAPFAQIPHSSSNPPLTRIVKLDYQPTTGDLFVLDLRGKLYKLQNGQPTIYMDMAALQPKFINQPGLATGFGSFAFHPDFAKNGLLYTTHTEFAGAAKADFDYPDSIPVTLQWVITEWKTDPSSFPFSGKGRELLRINMPTPIHGMQEISFNQHARRGDSDYGLLYIGIGDGGSVETGFPLVATQPKRPWGSILRIDPRGNNSRNGHYGIPADNPFSKSKDLAGEVYAYGFRNPHRFNWTHTGQMLAINIGQTNIEALDIVSPGHFYGWPIREGTFEERFFNDAGKIYPLPANDTSYHVTYPVAQFDHDEGTAISGGFEYSGSNVPQLTGKYIFADIGTGKLFFVNMNDLKQGRQATIKKWNITINGKPTTLAELCGNSRVEVRFGKDSKGELYVMTKADGKVYRLVNREGGIARVHKNM